MLELVAATLLAMADPEFRNVVTGGPVSAPESERHHRWDRNYEVGVSRQVVVGEQLVRRKDRVVSLDYRPAFRETQGFGVKAGIGGWSYVSKGDQLLIVGVREIKGRRYQIVDIPGTYALLVDFDGNLFPKLANRWIEGEGWVVMVPGATFLNDRPPALERVNAVTRTEEVGGENIEIVYNGTDGQSLRFTYREYTKDDMARPAFAQDLTYPAAVKTFRFKGFVFRVEKVSDDALTYTVVDDGTASPAAP